MTAAQDEHAIRAAALAWLQDVTLPQWQHEMTSADRIWYCPDKDSRTIWVTKVSLSHRKQNE